MLKEFREFAMRGNMMDLAIGVIIGGAFGKIIASLVNDILMPLIGLVLGKVSFVNLFVALDGNQYAARSIVLAGTFHFPMLDQPGRFARLLRDFIDVDNPEQLQDLSIKEEWRRRTR